MGVDAVRRRSACSARLADSAPTSLPESAARAIGRAQTPTRRRNRPQPSARGALRCASPSARRRRCRRTGRADGSGGRRRDARQSPAAGCAGRVRVSLVTSRHEARQLVRRARARAGARAIRDRVRAAATRAIDVGDAGARRKDRARAVCNMQLPAAGRIESRRAARAGVQ